MNDFRSNPISSPASTAELQQQIQSLHSTLTMTLALFIVVSGCVLGNLWAQKRILNKQLSEVQQTVDGYEKVSGNIYVSFVNNLQNLARTYHDLNPILEKYGLAANQTATPQTPPAPRVATPPKK